MTHMNIFTNPYHTLHQISTPVMFGNEIPYRYNNWSQFEEDYLHCMKENRGLGLAANQLGFTKRIFGMGHNSFDTFKKPAILYNARINSVSDQVEISEEGCLSFPGVIYNVYRSTEIEVEWQNMIGEIQSATLKGLEARVFQHEFDHINGITFDQRAEEFNL